MATTTFKLSELEQLPEMQQLVILRDNTCFEYDPHQVGRDSIVEKTKTGYRILKSYFYESSNPKIYFEGDFLGAKKCLLDSFAHKKALRLRAEKILEMFLSKPKRTADLFVQEAASLWTDGTSIYTKREDGNPRAIIETHCSGNGFSGYQWVEPIPEWLYMSDRKDYNVVFEVNLARAW